MAALDEKVRIYARDYIDQFKDRGSCEFMGEFAFKFPIAVFLELMGLPQEDVEQLLAWEMNLLHQPDEIGRAHVCTPVTNAHLVCRLLLEKKKSRYTITA